MNICDCGYLKYCNDPACCFLCYKKKGHGSLCKKILKYKIDESEKYFFETSDSGLGDRLGQVITVCSYAECFGIDKIVILWKNSAHRNYLLSDIQKYLTFPKNCIVTDDNNMIKDRKPLYLFNNLRKWDHSFDIVPETAFLLLKENYHWDTSKYNNLCLDDFIFIHKSIASQITIDSKILKGNVFPQTKYKCIHIRRDDKLISVRQPFIPKCLVNKIVNDYSNHLFFIVSDDKIPQSILNINQFKLYTDDSLNNTEKVLLDMYILVNSTDIISVIYSDGWSSFSYVCSKIGNINLLSFVPVNTRYSTLYNFTNSSKLDMYSIEYII